ncbi:hypothetical protein Zm00014a_034482 [Zea mays]|uniref:Uncharacterized protein n=1 Tax=Zea mays TaxID=4577 RepID=A0A3L6F1P8_MAIZE|nr:hypothetical protein Zm00014a_034482 [Zea mays]
MGAVSLSHQVTGSK